MKRFDVGSEYLFVTFFYPQGEVPAKYYGVFPDAEIRPVFTRLRCTQERDVAMALADGGRVTKGYVFEDSNGTQYYNQYPCGEYSGGSTLDDYVVKEEGEAHQQHLLMDVWLDIFAESGEDFPGLALSSPAWVEATEKVMAYLHASESLPGGGAATPFQKAFANQQPRRTVEFAVVS